MKVLSLTFASVAGLLLLCAGSQLVAAQDASSINNNAASACVQYGDCTTLGQNTFATATQQAPVTPPAFTPGLATIINPLTDTAYLSSLAAAGGSKAFNENGGATGSEAGGQQQQQTQGSAQNDAAPAATSVSINLGPLASSQAGSNAASSLMTAGLTPMALVFGVGALIGGAVVL